ncbi:MAG: ribosome-binding factor A [Anaerolineaceae bacterium 4572_78]|nr:MAG: ribosome-binding factor A [Anaerolineaceae bacterium 4572_78]
MCPIFLHVLPEKITLNSHVATTNKIFIITCRYLNMPTRRQQRIAKLIRQEISKLLLFNTRDPRINFVTVTEVKISSDLKSAMIYVSLLQDDEKDAMSGLESATPYLRRQLAQNVSLRYMPKLVFKIDRTLAHAKKIEDLLSEDVV